MEAERLTYYGWHYSLPRVHPSLLSVGGHSVSAASSSCYLEFPTEMKYPLQLWGEKKILLYIAVVRVFYYSHMSNRSSFVSWLWLSQSGWCTPWLNVMICLDSLCRRASKCYLWPPAEGKSPPCYLVPHLLIIYLNIYLMGKWKIKEQCSIKIILTILFRMFFFPAHNILGFSILFLFIF